MAEDSPHSRRLIKLTGEEVIHFLQGILTQDVTKLAEETIQFAALLSPQGKILHDMFVIDGAAIGLTSGTILLDTPAMYAATLLKRLALYKLRAKVAFTLLEEGWDVGFSLSQGLPDPRHPALPRRVYAIHPASEITSDTYRTASLALGIPESAFDFAPDEVVAMDAGYDLLHAISFTKGCYVGQEVTARMHYKTIARRGFYRLEQDGVPKRLALLKFETVETSEGLITLDGSTYEARLPEWMAPKFAQFALGQ